MEIFDSSINDIHDKNIFLENREIFLFGNDGLTDEQLAFDTIKNIRILESISVDPITIHQLNYGGGFSAGMAIYDVIKYSKCKFLFLCHGSASSMGSILPQAVIGKGLRVTYPNCDWLIHEGSLELNGSYRHVKEHAEYNKILLDRMYDIYAIACSKCNAFKKHTKKQIKNFLEKQLSQREDWILTAEDAVFHGFADAIYGTKGYSSYEEIKNVL